MLKKSLIGSLALAGALTCQTAVFGADQEQPGNGQRVQQFKARIEQVAKELNLTAEQKEQLKPLLQQELQQARAIRQDATLSAADKRAKLKALREEMAPKMKQILTPEQLAKWQKMRQEHRGEKAD